MTEPAVAETTTTDLDLTDDEDDTKPKELDPGWPHQRIEYAGDSLAVRYAQMQALMAYQLSSGKYITMERQNDASGLFIDQHFGPDTYDRIMFRMTDPDDPDYTTKSFAEIMGLLVKASIAKIKADAAAEKQADLNKAAPTG